MTASGPSTTSALPPSPPYGFQLHWIGGSLESPREYAMEFWPLKGRWFPFFVAVPRKWLPIMEFAYLASGLRGDSGYARRPRDHHTEAVASRCGYWWVMRSTLPANAVQSCFLFCRRFSPFVVFGMIGGPSYNVLLTASMQDLKRLDVPPPPSVDAGLWPSPPARIRTFRP